MPIKPIFHCSFLRAGDNSVTSKYFLLGPLTTVSSHAEHQTSSSWSHKAAMTLSPACTEEITALENSGFPCPRLFLNENQLSYSPKEPINGQRMLWHPASRALLKPSSKVTPSVTTSVCVRSLGYETEVL